MVDLFDIDAFSKGVGTGISVVQSRNQTMQANALYNPDKLAAEQVKRELENQKIQRELVKMQQEASTYYQRTQAEIQSKEASAQKAIIDAMVAAKKAPSEIAKAEADAKKSLYEISPENILLNQATKGADITSKLFPKGKGDDDKTTGINRPLTRYDILYGNTETGSGAPITGQQQNQGQLVNQVPEIEVQKQQLQKNVLDLFNKSTVLQNQRLQQRVAAENDAIDATLSKDELAIKYFTALDEYNRDEANKEGAIAPLLKLNSIASSEQDINAQNEYRNLIRQGLDKFGGANDYIQSIEDNKSLSEDVKEQYKNTIYKSSALAGDVNKMPPLQKAIYNLGLDEGQSISYLSNPNKVVDQLSEFVTSGSNASTVDPNILGKVSSNPIMLEAYNASKGTNSFRLVNAINTSPPSQGDVSGRNVGMTGYYVVTPEEYDAWIKSGRNANDYFGQNHTFISAKNEQEQQRLNNSVVLLQQAQLKLDNKFKAANTAKSANKNITQNQQQLAQVTKPVQPQVQTPENVYNVGGLELNLGRSHSLMKDRKDYFNAIKDNLTMSGTPQGEAAKAAYNITYGNDIVKSTINNLSDATKKSGGRVTTLSKEIEAINTAVQVAKSQGVELGNWAATKSWINTYADKLIGSGNEDSITRGQLLKRITAENIVEAVMSGGLAAQMLNTENEADRFALIGLTEASTEDTAEFIKYVKMSEIEKLKQSNELRAILSRNAYVNELDTSTAQTLIDDYLSSPASKPYTVKVDKDFKGAYKGISFEENKGFRTAEQWIKEQSELQNPSKKKVAGETPDQQGMQEIPSQEEGITPMTEVPPTQGTPPEVPPTQQPPETGGTPALPEPINNSLNAAKDASTKITEGTSENPVEDKKKAITSVNEALNFIRNNVTYQNAGLKPGEELTPEEYQKQVNRFKQPMIEAQRNEILPNVLNRALDKYNFEATPGLTFALSGLAKEASDYVGLTKPLPGWTRAQQNQAEYDARKALANELSKDHPYFNAIAGILGGLTPYIALSTAAPGAASVEVGAADTAIKGSSLLTKAYEAVPALKSVVDWAAKSWIGKTGTMIGEEVVKFGVPTALFNKDEEVPTLTKLTEEAPSNVAFGTAAGLAGRGVFAGLKGTYRFFFPDAAAIFAKELAKIGGVSKEEIKKLSQEAGDALSKLPEGSQTIEGVVARVLETKTAQDLLAIKGDVFKQEFRKIVENYASKIMPEAAEKVITQEAKEAIQTGTKEALDAVNTKAASLEKQAINDVNSQLTYNVLSQGDDIINTAVRNEGGFGKDIPFLSKAPKPNANMSPLENTRLYIDYLTGKADDVAELVQRSLKPIEPIKLEQGQGKQILDALENSVIDAEGNLVNQVNPLASEVRKIITKKGIPGGEDTGKFLLEYRNYLTKLAKQTKTGTGAEINALANKGYSIDRSMTDSTIRQLDNALNDIVSGATEGNATYTSIASNYGTWIGWSKKAQQVLGVLKDIEGDLLRTTSGGKEAASSNITEAVFGGSGRNISKMEQLLEGRTSLDRIRESSKLVDTVSKIQQDIKYSPQGKKTLESYISGESGGVKAPLSVNKPELGIAYQTLSKKGKELGETLLSATDEEASAIINSLKDVGKESAPRDGVTHYVMNKVSKFLSENPIDYVRTQSSGQLIKQVTGLDTEAWKKVSNIVGKEQTKLLEKYIKLASRDTSLANLVTTPAVKKELISKQTAGYLTKQAVGAAASGPQAIAVEWWRQAIIISSLIGTKRFDKMIAKELLSNTKTSNEFMNRVADYLVTTPEGKVLFDQYAKDKQGLAVDAARKAVKWMFVKFKEEVAE